jgi:hypothetical protein
MCLIGVQGPLRRKSAGTRPSRASRAGARPLTPHWPLGPGHGQQAARALSVVARARLQDAAARRPWIRQLASRIRFGCADGPTQARQGRPARPCWRAMPVSHSGAPICSGMGRHWTKVPAHQEPGLGTRAARFLASRHEPLAPMIAGQKLGTTRGAHRPVQVTGSVQRCRPRSSGSIVRSRPFGRSTST